MRRSLSLVIAGLLIAGCSSAAPGFTVPPGFTIPPFTIPSIPSFELPSGLPTIPPIVLPTPGGPPAEGNLCHAVTLQEMSAFAGGTAALASGISAGECEWQITKADSFIPATVALNLDDPGNDLAVIKTVFPQGQDVAIAEGGYWVPVISTLWFVDGGSTYSVLSAFLTNDPALTLPIAQQIATTAASRL